MTKLSHRLTRMLTHLLAPLALSFAVFGALSLDPQLCAAQVAGAGTITGTITSDTGQPVTGVQVVLVGRGLGAVSDADGLSLIHI